MKRYHSNQKGITLTGVLIAAALIIFFVYVAIKLVPVYLENFSVGSSLKAFVEEETHGASAGEARSRLLRRLELNSVRSVEPEHIKIRQEGGQRIVTIEYEVRTHFYGNLYLLASFNNSAVLSGK